MPEIIKIKIISKYHDNLFISHFGIKKTKKLVVQKYYWPTLQADIETYLKEFDICIGSKTIKHKLYSNLQSLPILTHS